MRRELYKCVCVTLWFLPHHILLSEFLDQRAAPYPPSSLHDHSVSHFIHHIKKKRKLNLLFFTYYTPRYRDVSLSIAEEILIKTNIFTGKINIFYMSFIVAGVVEEGLKELVLIPNLLKEKSFNERLDGIIYSVFLSLGFATIENIIYILFEDQTSAFEVGVIRSIISVPAHMMFAVII